MQVGDVCYLKKDMKTKIVSTAIIGGMWNLYLYRFDVLDDNGKVIDKIMFTTDKISKYVKQIKGKNIMKKEYDLSKGIKGAVVKTKRLKYGDLVKLKENVHEKVIIDKFKDDIYVFMGELNQMRGHCILAHFQTEMLAIGYHTDNFRVITEDEF